jgi:disulfide bond formation protein DsbB
MIKYQKLTLSHLLSFMIFAAAIAILFAYIAQYFFNFTPCPLCLLERKPFFIILILAALLEIYLALTNIKQLTKVKYQRLVFFICITALMINCLLSLYHVGVEKKIFAEPTSCSSGTLNQYDNIDDLRSAISSAKIARCSDPAYILPFLSMAMLNFIYCLFLTATCIFIYNQIGEVAEYKYYQRKIF